MAVAFGCALIGRLAVDQSCHGVGLGQLLLADAIKRIVTVSDSVAMHAAIVHAKNDTASWIVRWSVSMSCGVRNPVRHEATSWTS